MPTFEKPPAPSTIRERALKSALARGADATKRLNALQDYQRSGLSPLELQLQAARSAYYQNVINHSSDLITAIRQQNIAVDAERRANPLWPARSRGLDPHRSSRDRVTAILGTLEYERRRNAPLRRDTLDRAQALAASRSRYDLRQAYRVSGTSASSDASFRGEASFFDLRGVDMPVPSGPDPCEEWQRKQRNRREVFFARGLAPRGYRVPHVRGPC